MANLATITDPESALENAMPTRGADDMLFLEVATIVERGKRVAKLCEIRFVFAGGVSS